MANVPTLPAWVRTADGRLEAFDGDRIAQRLYRALADSGRADPLLSRELADGVLHFLAADQPPVLLSAAELAEHVVKIVRELGYPELARALVVVKTRQLNREERETAQLLAPAEPPCDDLPRDVEAAINAELLVPLGLGRNSEMAGGAIPPTPPGRAGQPGWIEALLAARRVYCRFLAVDGPEWLLAESDSDLASWLREFRAGLRATHLRVVVNLNVTTPPWIPGCVGPLFPSDAARAESAARQARLQLLSALIDAPLPGVRIDWHYRDPGCWSPEDRHDLGVALRAARRGVPIAFVPDRRPECPALAEGIDRANPEMLGAVGIRWQRLEQAAPTCDPQFDAFAWALDRLPQVVSLIAAIARSRRRRILDQADHPLQHARRLDRARFVIAPLEAAASSGPADRVDGRMRLIAQRLAAAIADCHDVPLTLGAPPLDFDDGEFDWAPDAAIRPATAFTRSVPARIDASGRRVQFALPDSAWRDLDVGLAALAWAYRSTRASHVGLRRAAMSRPLALNW